MITKPSVELDARDALGWFQDILARRPGYTPEWLAPDRSAGAALARIVARYLETVAQRLNQAPARNKLAFLDQAGLQLVPAQAARAPVVFQLADQAGGGAAPARTPVAAPPPPGGSDQIVFETERAVGVTGGKIAQVFSLWPGRDEYVDHTAAFLAGQPVSPFAAALREPTPHHLYLAHSVLLALAGNVELAVQFELKHPATSPLPILWEFWDGKVWRGFMSTNPECRAAAAQDVDSTDGLTQSGHYVLRADGAQAAKTTVAGVESYWLRGRLTDPLPPDASSALPEVDDVRIASTVNRVLRGRIKVSEPRAPGRGTSVSTTGAGTTAGVSTLIGVVTNEAGKGIEGAIVRLFDRDGAETPAFTAKTNASGIWQILNVNFATDYSYDVLFADLRFWGPPATLKPKERASAAKPEVDLTLTVEGLAPDKAFADGASLDVSKPFYPLGQQPQPGTAFYFTSAEAFTKPGAKVRIYLARTNSPQDENANPDPNAVLGHQVNWEYWNGRQWAPLAVTSSVVGSWLDLDVNEIVDFTVPVDMVPVVVNGENARWARVRLQSGTYGFKQTVSFKTGGTPANADPTFTYVVVQPPVLASFRIGYTWQYGPFNLDHVTTYNDFRYRDETEAAMWPGTTFRPFDRVADVTPALYLGFDKQPPSDQLGLFFDVREVPGEPAGPALVWEYWDGLQWGRLPAEDETGYLRRPGIVTVLAQPDDAALDRFGTPLHWLRARLKEDGPPGEPVFDGVFANAVWASERRTLHDVAVGASSGTPNQAFGITHTPVLAGERLEVRELSGARANVEWRILAMELFGGDATVIEDLDAELGKDGTGTTVSRGLLRLTRNRRKQVTEAWVGWDGREQLFFSGPDDRHYAIDRAVGRLYFGDGVTGRVPPVGAAIVIREMTTGGGSRGNVATRSITQLLGVVPGIQAVFNPHAAEGGADGETPVAALDRGPRTIRHRGRALLAADYETLAAEASPAVAVVRAIAGRNPSGVRLPGWITLLIVPYSHDRRPYPSFGLREHVRTFIEGRAPADVAALHRINVTGPRYLAVDVAATVAPLDPSEAGAVEKRVRDALESFLHPLFGGPGGKGWDLGRDVFPSDVAAEIERVDGVDYVEELTLLSNGVPQGESLAVGDDQIVAAGTITLKLREAER